MKSKLSLYLLLVLSIGLYAGGQGEPDTTAPAVTIPGKEKPLRPEITPEFPTFKETISPWWKDRTFYEIYVYSFQDSDGDGKGDIKGLISRLDYIQSMGFNGLWLMPVNKTADNQEHGYHPTDFKDIQSYYGTLQDYKNLMAECKKRDIKVLFDLVINHTSREHPWFQASKDPSSPFRSYYVWDEAGGKKANWHTLPEALNGPTYFGRFNALIPDLDLTNPAVVKEVNEIARFWLKDIGVDGFRMDAIKHLVEEGNKVDSTQSSLNWLSAFKTYVKSIKPDAYTLGEVFGANFDEMKLYSQTQVDGIFNFPFSGSMISAAGYGTKSGLVGTFKQMAKDYPSGDFASFLSNHDQDRVMTQLSGDMESGKVAASLLLTSPGTPFVYYGEEIGQFGDKKKGGDNAWRRPMQWDPTPKTFGFTTGRPYGKGFDQGGEERTVADMEKAPDSLLNHYKTLTNLRNAHPELRTGGTLILETSNSGVFAMLRYTTTARTLVLVNLKASAQENYGVTLWNGPFTAAPAPTLLFGSTVIAPAVPEMNATGGFDFWKPLTSLPPKSTYIIKL